MLKPHRSASLVVFAALGAACGGADPKTNAQPDALTSATPTYSVPVPVELQSQATFPVRSVKWSVVGTTATLKYDLPAELTGTAQRVDLQGAFVAERGIYALSGPAGTAECSVTSVALRCDERLQGVTVDVARAEALAASASAPAKRLEVVRRFGVDPIGILDAPLGALEPDDDGTHQNRGGGG